MPGGTVSVTSFSPITWPYHFDRCSAAITLRHATTSTPRTRRSRMSPERATSPTIISSETGHGVSYRERQRGRSTSPTCVRSSGNDTHAIVEPRVTNVEHAVERLAEEDQRGVQHADVPAALRQRREREHRGRDRHDLDEREQVIAGNRNRLLRKNVKLPANAICTTSSTIAGTHVTSSRKAIRIGELAEDVFGARQWLREIDLQRVRAAVVRDQPGADIHGDEEDENLLLVQELTERFGVGARKAACGRFAAA